jgi:hypothetical protein
MMVLNIITASSLLMNVLRDGFGAPDFSGLVTCHAAVNGKYEMIRSFFPLSKICILNQMQQCIRIE